MKICSLEKIFKHDSKEWDRVVSSLTEDKKSFSPEACERSKVVGDLVGGLKRAQRETEKTSSLKLKWDHPAYLLRWFH